MIMKRWRVGSFSMGLILVASGILMLVSLIVRVNVLNVLLAFWPLILICLGIEILLHLFVRKSDDTDSKLRYDALSIFFISFLLIISIGFYAVTYFSGLFESQDDMFAAFGIMNERIYVEDSTTLTGTKELVVFNGINGITVLLAEDEQLKIRHSISVGTSDKGYAESVIGNSVHITPGERAYLRSDRAIFHNNRKMGWPMVDVVIYLPSETILDLSQHFGFLEYDNAIAGQIIRHNEE